MILNMAGVPCSRMRGRTAEPQQVLSKSMAELAPIAPAAVGAASPDPAAVVPAAAVGTAAPVAAHAEVKTELTSPGRRGHRHHHR